MSAIKRIDGVDLFFLELAPDTASTMIRVSHWGDALLQHKKVRAWAKRCNPRYLEALMTGTERLSRLGRNWEVVHAVGPRWLADVHEACCFVTHFQNLTTTECDDLRELMLLIAQALVRQIADRPLPEWREFAPVDLKSGEIQLVYEQLRTQTPDDGGYRKLRLADAHILRDYLGIRMHPKMIFLWEELSEITASHRRALTSLSAF